MLEFKLLPTALRYTSGIKTPISIPRHSSPLFIFFNLNTIKQTRLLYIFQEVSWVRGLAHAAYFLFYTAQQHHTLNGSRVLNPDLDQWQVNFLKIAKSVYFAQSAQLNIWFSAHCCMLIQLMIIRVSTTTNFVCKGLYSETFISCSILIFQRSTPPKIQKETCHYSFRQNFCHFGGASEAEDGTHSSFLESSCLQHWFKNWHELRKNRLTASTFTGAIGFWPQRRVQLWLEKIGARKPFLGNLATVWGNIKEEEALERYKLITGNTVLFPEFQVHGERNSKDVWLGCSPDGVVDRVVYGLPSRGVLEIKCPYFNGDNRIMYPWSRIPVYCIPQAQGLMEILDRDWMDFYCWTINGSSLFRIHRDQEYWELMKIALSDFWWNHVIPAKELYRKSSTVIDPLIGMRSLRPAPRHELFPNIVVASKYVVDDSELKMREIHGILQRERSWNFP